MKNVDDVMEDIHLHLLPLVSRSVPEGKGL
jgi:hypothetical protein